MARQIRVKHVLRIEYVMRYLGLHDKLARTRYSSIQPAYDKYTECAYVYFKYTGMLSSAESFGNFHILCVGDYSGLPSQRHPCGTNMRSEIASLMQFRDSMSKGGKYIGPWKKTK